MGTDFGRRHGFRRFRSVADFRAAVPVRGWEEFAGPVDAVRRGARGVLAAAPVERLVPTGGTSGGAKLVPYTAVLRRETTLLPARETVFQQGDLAVIAVERCRPWIATLVVAVTGLGRETNVLGGAAIADRMPRSPGAVARIVAQGLIMALPLVGWLLLVHRLHPDTTFDVAGGRNFAFPLAGFIGK